MPISVDLTMLATMAPHRTLPPLWSSLHYSSKLDHSRFLNGGEIFSDITLKRSHSPRSGLNVKYQSNLTFGVVGEDKMSVRFVSQDAESFLLNAINMSIFERLSLAWKIIFPSSQAKCKSNANIAKQRLKMILFSDRCAVSDEAKNKIVKSIVSALSDFVEIESQEKVQLNMSTDMGLGTVYSVTVPVRRVKSEYQEEDEAGSITNIEYIDDGKASGSVDVKFDFYVPVPE